MDFNWNGMITVKKRTPRPFKDHDPLSAILRSITEDIQVGDIEKALQKIDAYLQQDQENLSRFLALAGDTQLKKKDFSSSLHAYLKARGKSKNADQLNRATRGVLAAYVGSNSYSQAQELALQTYAQLKSEQDAYLKAKSLLGNVGPNMPKVVIPERPPNAASILISLAILLERQGQFESAIAILATVEAQYLGSRGTAVLARLHARLGNLATSTHLISPYVATGKLPRVILGAFSEILAISPHGSEGLRDLILQAAIQGGQGRKLLHVATALHTAGDSAWVTPIQDWLSENEVKSPSVASEMIRLLIAEAKVRKDRNNQIELARQLLNCRGSTFVDAICACHTILENSKKLGTNVNVNELFQFAKTRHSEAEGIRIQQAIATSCANLERTTEARVLYSDLIEKTAGSPSVWGRAVGAKAKMEMRLGNNEQASEDFFKLASNEAISPEFRLYGFQKWLACIGDGTTDAAFEQNLPTIQLLLGDVATVSGLCLAARRLKFCPGEAGTALSMQCLKRAQDLLFPGGQITVSEGNAHDFQQFLGTLVDVGNYDQALECWGFAQQALREMENSFDVTRAATYVAQAYVYLDRTSDAATLPSWLASAACSKERIAEIWVGIGHAFVVRKQYQQALTYFTKALDTKPDCDFFTARAYFWKALDAYTKSQKSSSLEYVNKVVDVLSKRSGMIEERDMLAQLLVLLRQMAEPNSEIENMLPAALIQKAIADLDQRLKALRS